MSTIHNYVEKNSARFLDELKDLLRIPSISADPEHRADMVTSAEWLAGHLKALGLKSVDIIELGDKSAPPLVFAESENAGPDAVLIYGHYDVQPVDPLDQWQSDPFTPTIRGDNLYARGASDMKGQIIATLKAVEFVMGQGRQVPVKFLLEGEEEVGSDHLPRFIDNHREMLACAFCLNPDAGMLGPDLPTVTYALRGISFCEIRLSGPRQDLHSGLFGGAVHNPAQVLCDLLAGMHDNEGRVTLPGFYDSVRPLDAAERQELSHLPNDESFYLRHTGVPALWGETGYTPNEQIGGRPTLEINGMLAGFTGEGPKTIIPSEAMAKISMRLVPDQDPDQVEQQLRRYLQNRTPATVNWSLEKFDGGPASICDRDAPGVQALSRAMETVWGTRPLFKREGGSIPIVGSLQKYIGAQSVLTGFALPGDNAHSPNEKLHLPTWKKGSETLIYFFDTLAGRS